MPKFFVQVLILSSVLSLVLTGSGDVLAQSVGFAQGNEMSAISLMGEATLTCIEGQEQRTVQFECRDSALNPNDFDYFVGPTGLGAETVELSVTRSDGSLRTKSQVYNSNSGTSRARFNLWMNSVVQRPLLSYGRNRVDYRLLAGGKVVSQGQFAATVKSAGQTTCESGEFYSTSLNDCDQPYTFCRKYFDANQNCR